MTCPYGILNLNAAAETVPILSTSPKEFHKKLRDWLSEHYLEDRLGVAALDGVEPLGRRIRSVQDLSLLVCAYSNARALKQKTMKRGMDHELYFYGHTPDHNAAVDAGRLLRYPSDPGSPVGFALDGR